MSHTEDQNVPVEIDGVERGSIAVVKILEEVETASGLPRSIHVRKSAGGIKNQPVGSRWRGSETSPTLLIGREHWLRVLTSANTIDGFPGRVA